MCKRLIASISFVLVMGTVFAGAARADLVAHWRLDEGSGTTASDASGNGNDGTVQGDPKWVVGYFGGALEFDGADDWLDCGSDPSLDLTTWTIMFWLNLNENKSFNAYVVKGLDAAENYEVLTYGDGHFHFPILFTDGSRTFGNTDAGISVVGEWAHYAYTYDSTEGRRFYKDGSLVFEDTESGTPQTSTTSLAIGNEQPMSRHVNGTMDDIRIYNESLTEVEIQAAMEGADAYPYALGPSPSDGALHEDTWVTLSWSAGDFAVSHDVYLSEDFDNVKNATIDMPAFQGNQTETILVAGFPGFPYPDGLVPGTTYYWRIDEVNDSEPNSPWRGDVWSFSVPPKTAYSPDPPDGAEF
ncbi:MAG: LamG domain-containing protein, partial [Planctomycetota bacterium]